VRLAAVSIVGLALFVWPFAGLPLPPTAPAVAVALGAVVGLAALESGARRLDSRGLALLAALSALATALRLLVVTGIGGFSPFFLPVLCAGFAMGPSFGFLAGALGILVSALATGGVGPWLPYQLFAAGWTGMVAGWAGLAVRGRGGAWPIVLLAAVGAVCGYAFGAVMDVWDWSSFFRGGDLGWQPGLAPAAALARFARFYAVSSFAYDSFRAVGNALLVLAVGAPIVAALARLRARLRVEVVPLDSAW
jgi:energy-coupling factor transport system substrate-specific component